MSKIHEAFLANLTFEQNMLKHLHSYIFLDILCLHRCVITVSCFYSHLYFPLDQFAGEQ